MRLPVEMSFPRAEAGNRLLRSQASALGAQKAAGQEELRGDVSRHDGRFLVGDHADARQATCDQRV
jgi:hypothetical protein